LQQIIYSMTSQTTNGSDISHISSHALHVP
jgi:hypothetical protein